MLALRSMLLAVAVPCVLALGAPWDAQGSRRPALFVGTPAGSRLGRAFSPTCKKRGALTLVGSTPIGDGKQDVPMKPKISATPASKVQSKPG